MSGVPSSHWNFTLQPRDRNPRNLRTVNSDAPSGRSVFTAIVSTRSVPGKRQARVPSVIVEAKLEAHSVEERGLFAAAHGVGGETGRSPAATLLPDDGGREPGPVYYDLFEEFADLATKCMCPVGAPDERGHKDGWGLACFQNGAPKMHMRDAGCAADASRYYGTAWKIAKLNIERASGQSLIVMGHLRRASAAGLVARKYAHPFIEERDGVTWAFQHNGSLVNDPEEPGLLDSQVLFHSLLDRLTSRTHEGLAEATTAVRDMAIDKYGGFTGLNFMLSDGDSLHGYRDFQTNGQYYTLYIDNLGEMVIAASEPILAMIAEPIPRGVLHTVRSDLDVQRTTIS